ncbi:nucleotidyltransferase domain-containing protein [Paenibacillus filicis]|uniref:Nucleotidyltransferase domain-containing protein n=1 Tax=Paenibacillus gyeongsangnamensis TaxID=3388067 RepID=A0ABT4QFQ3_9BACL|nr:nucleotidyltransferase domain-containing protein [Paenibacillus filicis]MCZ8515571.1 nucleotidyltransferase domain-containing protein [Paenibacillus filicis]
MRVSAYEAATKFVDQFFPSCEGAILAGSVVIGRATASSDLDLIVFDESAGMPSRRTFREYGWVVEAFVLTRDTYRHFFDQGVDSAIPSLQRMCANGLLLRGQGVIEDIVEEAREELLAGPPTWSAEDIDKARYEITEALDDLEGSSDRGERHFIVHKLQKVLCEFILRVNGHWLGDGKWVYRGLAAWNASWAKRLTDALDSYYGRDDPDALRLLALESLAPYGGLLMEGYAEGFEPAGRTGGAAEDETDSAFEDLLNRLLTDRE